MEARESNVLKFLELGNHQFVIPVYQRTYKWTRINCKQIMQDILKASQPQSKTHFLGSIVYITDEHYQATQVNKLTIIDGQQRLTTISLLLMAMVKNLQEQPKKFKTTPTKLLKKYLVIDEDETNKPEDFISKLSLTKHDRDFYNRLVKNQPLRNNNQNIYNNFEFFYNEIKNKEIDIDTLFEGIGKLLIVSVSLVRTKDDPQLIFESLNSTGVKLEQADLIRNFLLMDLDDNFQKEVYNTYWYPMEISLRDSLSDFIRDYLIIKSKKIPNKAKVYEEFKKYFYTNFDRAQDNIENLVKDMYYYSTLYEKIVQKSETNPKINSYLIDFERLDVKVIYPFVLDLYSEYDKGWLLEEDFIYILNLLESCIVRRVIAGLPPNSLSKITISLIKDISEIDHVKSVEKILTNKRGVQRFPNEEEFKESFINRDIYSLKICKFLLDKLINTNSKVILNINEFSIEHIMPQTNNLSAKWVNALGDNWEQVHSSYLHTIGNLTLTRYNGEMGNKFFTDKRDMEKGYKDSPCRLNTDLIKLDTWNEEEILKRANKLFDFAKEIWSYPTVEATEENYNMILDFDDDWKSIKPSHFTFMDEKHDVKDMTDLYVNVISEIYQLDPELFLETINSPDLIGRNYISKNPSDFRASHQLLDTGFYINTHSNNDGKKKNLDALIKAIGLTENDLIIYLTNNEKDYVNN
ncbi:DUF262 domain-containing protein [Radiobacillus deserti]|uniref:DUF262 domain-containing protein n=1 Tax=Radiobacillus deserti TaxID=2594883 RepID=A0A516KDG5_9BACI|nr:DUF262 domain-containing protein [Radiobacillus deserti]QDP39445.1 DUF262 domain-containing protein [Radiobacillus deserti]